MFDVWFLSVWQLGGDLILDCAGRILYVYCSQRPPDRPDVHVLLGVIRVSGATHCVDSFKWSV